MEVMGQSSSTNIPHNNPSNPRTQIPQRSRITLHSGNKSPIRATISKFNNLSTGILDLLEIHKVLRTIPFTELSSLGACIDDNSTQTHGHGELNGLDTYATAAAGEDCPLAWSEARFFDRGVGGGGGTHYGTGYVVGHAVWD